MLNKEVVKLHFSDKAYSYDKNAVLQKNMASSLVSISGLEKDKNPVHILDVGCGTGFMIKLLSELFPNACFTLNDISEEMINICREKFYNHNAKFICADVEEASFSEDYNIIVSNAAFQWFNYLPETMSRLAKTLKSEGLLLFSTFGEHTFRELHISYRIAMQNLGMEGCYSPGQKFTDTKSLKSIIDMAFESECTMKIVEEIVPLYFDSVMDFFKSVRAIGANNSGVYVHRKPALLRELIRVYENKFGFSGKIRVTYHCVYGIVRKE